MLMNSSSISGIVFIDDSLFNHHGNPMEEIIVSI